MLSIIRSALSQNWESLNIGLELETPDNATGSLYSISSINTESMEITTSGGTAIVINRESLVSTLEYLLTNLHLANKPCAVGSNKDINNAGPLCLAARNANGENRMVINYILPILSHLGLLQIDGTRPNSVWVL